MAEKFGTNVYAPVVAGMDTDDDMPVAYNSELQGGIKVFADYPAMMGFTSKYPSRLLGSIAYQEDNRGWYKWTGTQEDGSDGKWNQLRLVDTGISLTVDGTTYSPVHSMSFKDFTATDLSDGTVELTPPNGTIGVEDLDNNDVFIGVDNVKFHSSTVETDPNETTSVIVTPYTSFLNQDGSENSRANQLKVTHPLKVFSNPDEQFGSIMEIDHSAFEEAKPPGFLVYLKENAFVKANDDIWDDEDHHKAAIWLGEVAVDGGHYVSMDMNGKRYELEEADTLDPNVTGGTDYLLAFRAAFVGKAPQDGFVRAYIIDETTNDMLLDTYGNPFIFHKYYEQDDALEHLEVFGIANFKGSRGLTLHVTTSFDLTQHNLELGNRTDGGTCFMAQAFTSTSKTGDALQQFELDTKQHLLFDTHFFGSDFVNIYGELDDRFPYDYPLAADESAVLPEGSFVYSVFGNTVNQTSGTLSIDGLQNTTNDFQFVRMLSADETLMLHDKGLKASLSVKNQSAGFNMDLVYWSGEADDYDKAVFKSRNQSQSPILESGWHLYQTMYWDENPAGFHDVDHEFIVPKEAVNVGIMIRPAFELTNDDFAINDLKIGATDPFTGYSIKGLDKEVETHLIYDEEYIEFAKGVNPGASGTLITLSPSPERIRVQTHIKGSSDIKYIPAGFAYQFQEDSRLKYSVALKLWNFSDKTETADFWWGKLEGDGSFTEVANTRKQFSIPVNTNGGIIFNMQADSLEFKKGDMIVLFGTTPNADGKVQIRSTGSSPTALVRIKFWSTHLESRDLYDAPISGLDLTQFDHVYVANQIATKVVNNASSAVIPINIPAGCDLSVIDAVKQMPDGSVRRVAKLDYSYNNGQLTVSFGETATVKVKILVSEE